MDQAEVMMVFKSKYLKSGGSLVEYNLCLSSKYFLYALKMSRSLLIWDSIYPE